MNPREMLAALAAPFPADAISWRVGSVSKDKSKGMALAYLDARDVMRRLDDVMGADWQCEYIPMPNGTCCCRIGLKIDGEWRWRSNGAGASDIEGEKGQYSDAMKRAAVMWGIGQYLYSLDSPWVKLTEFKQIEKSEYPRLEALLRRGGAPVAHPAPQIAPPAPLAIAPPVKPAPRPASVPATAIEVMDPVAAMDPTVYAPKPAAPKVDASKAPTARDSDAVRRLILIALDFCSDIESLTAWGKANGRQSPRWSLMTGLDQRIVLKAAEDKLQAVRAASAAAAGANPETGEVEAA